MADHRIVSFPLLRLKRIPKGRDLIVLVPVAACS